MHSPIGAFEYLENVQSQRYISDWTYDDQDIIQFMNFISFLTYLVATTKTVATTKKNTDTFMANERIVQQRNDTIYLRYVWLLYLIEWHISLFEFPIKSAINIPYQLIQEKYHITELERNILQ